MSRGQGAAGRLTVFEEELEASSLAVVADLHVEANRADLASIGRAMAKRGIGALAIAGDLYHKLHRPLSTSSLTDLLKWALARLMLPPGASVIYTPALFSHDPIVREKVATEVGGLSVKVLPGAARLKLPCGLSACVAHGDFLLKNGLMAGLLELTSLALARYPLLEALLRRELRARPGEWAFMGHTHLPLLDEGLRVANPGPWLNPAPLGPRGYMLVARPAGDGLKVHLLKALP
ncbi:MAG: hypothetical protein C4339_05590 [Nitrososphaerota archaeon]